MNKYAKEFYDVQKPGASVEPTTISLPRAQQVEDTNTLPAAKATVLKAELNKFMKKSLLRFEETKNADVEFKSDIIPPEAMNGIHSALKKVKDDAQIKYLFRNITASIKVSNQQVV